MLKETESRTFQGFVFAGLVIAASLLAAVLTHAAQNVQAFV